MNTPSNPQSRSATAASEISKPTTPSQIPLPSTPTPISNSKPASDPPLPLPQTPFPNPTCSVEKLKLAAQIPLPETPTPVVATSDVPTLVPNNSTPHLPPKSNRQSILASPTPTPDISPLKLTSSLSQSLPRHLDYRTPLIPSAGSSGLGEMPLLKKKDE